MKIKKSLLTLSILALLFGAASLASAEVYNWGNTDNVPLLQRVFGATGGHNHDGVNSTKITTVYNYAADTASTDTYVIAPSPAFDAYAAGMEIKFKAVTANTGACTVNVNGLGAKNLLTLNDVTPPDNYIEAGSIVVAVYDGTSFQMIQPDANP